MESRTGYALTQGDKAIHSGVVDCTTDDLDPGDVVGRVAYSDVN